MVQLFFSLRSQSQLRRTRPKLLRNLENSIISAIEEFGGAVKNENKLISAFFDSKTLGFWIDMLCMLESVKKALEKASSELYGHVCLIGRDVPDDKIPALLRSLPSELWGTGIWCSPEVRNGLESFIDFEDPEDTAGPGVKSFPSAYAQVRALREFGEAPECGGGKPDNAEKICQYLKQGSIRNTVVLGEEYTGIQEGLYRYCSVTMDDFPPLVIHFLSDKVSVSGSGKRSKKQEPDGACNAVTAIGDALNPEIKQVLDSREMAELEQIGEVLFRERLRDELSDFIIKQCERFFSLLLEAYRRGAEKQGVKPLLILENIQDADPLSKLIIMGVYFSRPSKERMAVYGTCSNMESLKAWEELFPRIIKFTPEKSAPPPIPEIPRALWEMGYCSRLFNRYFPPFLLSRLFIEEGKNPAMIEKSLLILSRLHISGSPDFMSHAEQVLGEGAAAVRMVVRNRLLAWVNAFRIKPCYRLLCALSRLGGIHGEHLMLDAVCSDIINGTYKGINRAIQDGTFSAVIGKEREAAMLAIVKTKKALTQGNQDEIKAAFKESCLEEMRREDPADAGFRAIMYADLAAYFLGICDTPSASAAVKEAMLLAQNENKGRDLAHIYRLFSLAEFAGHQLSDAIDYFAFAVENAEKSENMGELGIAAYYAAGAHFIFGNISKARRLAVRAREAALAAVLPGWADRSFFLEGRIRFETGRYQEALDIFKNLENNYLGAGTAEFKQTLAAWIFRCNIYLHNTGMGHKGGPDAELFEIEAAYLSGEYRKALELTGILEKRELGERFIFIEQPDWRSGFCQCELILFPLGDLWNRMIHTYRALALCHMTGGETHNREAAIQDMRRIMRDELPETDPNDAFYFHAYYQVLKRTGAPEVDMNTAVSIAFKRLQRRASRIDDNETKRSFLSSHYWNSALAAAAKEHKLI